jgi:hypothetical protein
MGEVMFACPALSKERNFGSYKTPYFVQFDTWYRAGSANVVYQSCSYHAILGRPWFATVVLKLEL